MLNMTRVGCRRTIEAMQKDIVHSITARGQECASNYIARLKYCAMFSVECDRGLQWRAHCGIISPWCWHQLTPGRLVMREGKGMREDTGAVTTIRRKVVACWFEGDGVQLGISRVVRHN